MSRLPGNYTFSNPKNMGHLTKSFMKFVQSCELYERPATKRAFYRIMKWKLAPGNNCTFFSAIRQAGIVNMVRIWNGKFNDAVYSRGRNWSKYVSEGLVVDDYRI